MMRYVYQVCGKLLLVWSPVSVVAGLSLAPQGLANGGYCSNRHSEVSLTVCEQNLAKLRVLVEDQGVDVNAPDEQGQTPLAVAFHSGSVYWMPVEPGMGPVIQYLLDRGADPNKPTSARGSMPLHEAAYTGNMVLVEALVKAGANVQAVNDAGLTPTQEAAACDFRLNRDDCSATGCSNDYQSRWRQGAKPVIAYLASKGAPLDQKLLDSFATPCQQTPALCTKDARRLNGQLATVRTRTYLSNTRWKELTDDDPGNG